MTDFVEGADEDDFAREGRRLFGQAQLTFVMEDWLRSPVGSYLVARAEKQRAEALEKLATTSPENAPAIRELQTRIRISDSWQQWIADAITEGQQAHKQLVDMGL